MNNRAPRFSYSRTTRVNLWSTEELRRLRALAEQGVSLSRIATLLCRSQSAVRNKAAMQGISVRTQNTLPHGLALSPTTEQRASTCADLRGAKRTTTC